jgi:hypothetical protein
MSIKINTTIDHFVDGSVNKVYTAAEKTKLSGIATNANNYVHPGSGTNPHGTTKADIGLSNVPNLAFSGSNTGDETATTLGTKINSATAKTTPVDADKFSIWNSVGGLLESVTWANIKATLKTYFDSIYEAAIGAKGTAFNKNFGSTADAVCQGNDSRLSDARTPIAHNHIAVIPHTFTISGEIKVPSGDTDFICPFYVNIPSGKTVKLLGLRRSINSGTSATIKLQRNGVDATGFTSLSTTTTATSTTPTSITLADNDRINLVVTAVSGTPKNLSVTLFLEYTL